MASRPLLCSVPECPAVAVAPQTLCASWNAPLNNPVLGVGIVPVAAGAGAKVAGPKLNGVVVGVGEGAGAVDAAVAGAAVA